jgi:antitoxin component YwqK of YwqJK toxin-antitoxin module|tara:strand:- start:4165 stop:4980 length:816 start_codon:yes stop_codon:yes gene_type:complete
MKNSFKTMLILALGAGMATLSSCSEDEVNDPAPSGTAPISCMPTEVTDIEDGDTSTTTYEYNSNGTLIQSIEVENGETTRSSYVYTADGKLSSVVTEEQTAVFTYAAGSSIPERINISEDGTPYSFIEITSSNGNITKIENSYYSGDEATLTDITSFTYVNGKLNSSIAESYDEISDSFIPELTISDITFDGKKSPFNSNLAFAFDGDIDPLAITPENIASGNMVAVIESQEVTLPIIGTYTYNENNYPITSRLSIANLFNNDNTYEYNCK